MSKIQKLIQGICLLILTQSWLACSHHEGPHQSLADIVKEHKVEPAHSVTSEKHLEELMKMLADVPDADSFYLPRRSVHMTSFPCSNCHTAGIPELKAGVPAGEKKAHWNIDLKHAKTEAMDCATCHNTKGDMDQLVSLTGKTIHIDESFKQCAQCHSTQYKDWVGGAHGKRLGSWAKPRVINNCTNCHNPHSPAFESRWPARLNTARAYPESKE